MSFGFKNKIQKIIVVMLVVSTIIGLLNAGIMITYAYNEQTGMIYSSDKSMVETKKEPSTSAAKANGLLYGKPVTVIDEVVGADGNMWYKLTYDLKAGGSSTGYCLSDNVLLDKDVTVFANGVINANDVKLRNDAGTDRTVILATLNVGHKVELLDTTTVGESIWYRVRTTVNNQTYIGWVYGSYINEVIPEIETDEEYENYLIRIGFPESYVHDLAVLHAQYPNWVFEPVKTGLDWDDVIANESTAGRNLIYKTADDAKKSYVESEYNWYTNEWLVRDTSGWVSAHTDYIAYCMDPRNFLNATNIFMFESLSYSPSHNIDGVNTILNGTFMVNQITDIDGTILNYADAFMQIGQASGVSPYHLASRVRQEQGVYGTSPMISGTYTGYEGYFNYFNVAAYGVGDMVYIRGLTYARDKGWNTRYKALLGGAEFLAKNYISVGQDTLYTQKFDVIIQGGLYNHQYMTAVETPISESRTVSRGYTDKTQAFVFKIPVYENMPEQAVQFAAQGNRNNYLKDLNITGLSLTPTFDGAKTTYSVIVDNEVSSITINAEPVVEKSKVSGIGTYNLDVGTNTFKIVCKSESGDEKLYTITVVREEAPIPDPPIEEELETPESPTEPEEPIEPEKPKYSFTSDKYKIDTYVTNVTPQTSVADFISGFQYEGCTIKVLNANGTENTSIIGTGNKINVYVDDELILNKEIVIYGDVSGDGKINALDAIKINRYTIGTTSLSGCYLSAGDVSGDEKTNALDAIMINRYTIGLSEIKQR